jgi:orotate phosphoribosyltransferase
MTEAGSSAAVGRALLEAGTLTLTPDAPVTFRSGLRSPVYVDNRRLIFHPGPWRVVIEAFEERMRRLPEQPEVVAGVEAAGIPHSSCLAYTSGMPSVFVRKQAKDHGLRGRVEGGDVRDRRAVLVEDMVTTGGSSLSAVEALREAGAVVTDCLAIITYGFPGTAETFAAAGVDLRVLTTFDVVVVEALARGDIDTREAELVNDWLRDSHGWSAR